MQIGIAGSRSLTMDIPDGLIEGDITMIYSGGAKGIDRSARRYAHSHHITITEILPEYDRYGKAAPLYRNDWIIRLSDFMYIFWDGKSRGSDYVIKKCKKENKPFAVYLWNGKSFIKQDM